MSDPSDNARIRLRPLTDDDVTDQYLEWFSDSDVTSFLEARNLQKSDVIKFIQAARESGRTFLYAIVTLESDKHIGNVKIGPVNSIHGTSDLVTVIGDKAWWGKGIATEAIRLANRLAFETHGVRKLNGGMYSDHTGSIKAYQKAGWVIEARLIGHYFQNGKIQDRIVVSCFNPTYFEIRDGVYVPRDVVPPKIT